MKLVDCICFSLPATLGRTSFSVAAIYVVPRTLYGNPRPPRGHDWANKYSTGKGRRIVHGGIDLHMPTVMQKLADLSDYVFNLQCLYRTCYGSAIYVSVQRLRRYGIVTNGTWDLVCTPTR